MTEKVLVTGASGYIASHAVNQLLLQNYFVRGTVRSLVDAKKVEPIKQLGAAHNDKLELVEADLLDEACWLKAVEGCDFVLHMASPFPNANPKTEGEIIEPAVQGTLNVLKACASTDSVKRVVLTSSVAAISSGHKTEGRIFTEDDWSVVEKVSMVYEKSKTLAEKAAWEYVSSLDEPKFELTVINPALVMGPVICGTFTTSMEFPKRIMMHDDPLLPKLNYAIIDVRDVAAAHINAMKTPEAAGKRHILSYQNIWVQEMAMILKEEFEKQGYNIPTKLAPYPLMWFLGRFDKSIKMVLPEVGKEIIYDNTRMVDVLKIKPGQLKDTILDMAYSLIEMGHVKKTKGYKHPDSVNL